MTSQCPYCGTAAKPNSAYCANCGQLLAAEAPAERAGAAAFPPPIGGAPAPGGSGLSSGIPILPPLPPMGPRPPVPLPAPLGAETPAAPPPPYIPPAPGVEPAAPVAPLPRPTVLRLPDGTQADLTGQLLLGRNPSAGEGLEGHVMLALDDPKKMLSRSHVAIDARGPRVTIVDLGSANGTTLVRSGSSTRLSPRLPVILEPGDRLLLGSLELDVA
jgi:hypothetical protein